MAWQAPSLGATREPQSSAAVTRLAAIVLNYRTPDHTLLAVQALAASHRTVDDLIVVDNGPLDRQCQVLTKRVEGVTYLSTLENLGFSGGMNVGIRAALDRGADAVLLVNSDAIVPPDCIAQLERCLNASPDSGIIGPVLRSTSDPSRIGSLGMKVLAHDGPDAAPLIRGPA